MVLRVQDAGTHRTAQSRVLVLDTVLTEQAGVVPLSARSRSTLDAYSAVLGSKEKLVSNTTLRTRRNQCDMNPSHKIEPVEVQIPNLVSTSTFCWQ